MMQESWPARALAVWLLGNLMFITAWDLVTIFFGLRAQSVSFQLYTWCEDYPRLYLLVGIAVGHLFLPLIVSPTSTH
jgi:hypothetical protein